MPSPLHVVENVERRSNCAVCLSVVRNLLFDVRSRGRALALERLELHNVSLLVDEVLDVLLL